MKPKHVGEDGNCAHCGGMVDEYGFAPLREEEEGEPFEGASTDQEKATVRMRHDSGFAEAIRRSRREE